MFGFIFKVLMVAGLVVGVFAIFSSRKHIPLAQILDKLHSGQILSLVGDKFKGIDTASVAGSMSMALDNLVTHPERNSPVVLGVKVTNDSLNTVVDVIQGLPTEQFDQLRSAICSIPTSTPSSPSVTPTP